jgi:hypothetical protein
MLTVSYGQIGSSCYCERDSRDFLCSFSVKPRTMLPQPSNDDGRRDTLSSYHKQSNARIQRVTSGESAEHSFHYLMGSRTISESRKIIRKIIPKNSQDATEKRSTTKGGSI